MPGPTLADSLSRSWQRAAADLGFQWEAPFHWFSPDSRRHTYLGLVRQFGRPGGVLVRILQLGEFPGTVILDEKYLVAKIGDRFQDYRRYLWLETLQEWGWAGPLDKKPNWLG